MLLTSELRGVKRAAAQSRLVHTVVTGDAEKVKSFQLLTSEREFFAKLLFGFSVRSVLGDGTSLDKELRLF